MNSAMRRTLTTTAGLAGTYLLWRSAAAWLRRYEFQNRLVVITGGSRGLGLLLARHLADAGAALVVCARDDEELASAEEELCLRAPFVAAYVCDLTRPPEIAELFNRIRREIGSVDVLINNAGIIQVGPVETMKVEDYEQAMAVHFWAPLLCMEQVLPDMRRRRDGRIVNISSIGGKIAAPHLLPYCASKYALVGLSKGMRVELAKDNIFVTTVSPGLMRTGSPRNALFKGQHRAEYTWFSISAGMPLLSMDANRAAQQIITACKFGRAELTLSLPAKLAVAIDALAPELTADMTTLANYVLPRPGGVGRTTVEGKDSTSAWSPSMLTALNERAALENNQIADDTHHPTAAGANAVASSPARIEPSTDVDMVDEASEGSFPASDPPSRTPVTSV